MRKRILFSCSTLILSLAVTAAPAETPNIVYILADDLGYGDPERYNPNSKIPTPNMNRLSDEGMRFTDAHTPSSVCTPTRYGVLTGRYCWRTDLKFGVLFGYAPNLIDPARLTAGKLLQRNGYTTACVGKWHLGLGGGEKTDYAKPFDPSPVDLGFDYFYGIPSSLDIPPYCYVENDRVVEYPSEEIEGSPRGPSGGNYWRAGAIAPSFKLDETLPTLTRKAVDYIENREPATPFFLYFPLSAPHLPWLPTEWVKGKSEAGVYGDFVALVDWSVGQVLDALDRTDAADDTLVIFTSDNGSHIYRNPDEYYIDRAYGHDANGPWRGQKADVWEGGHRVPFIVRWPGRVKPGTVSDETISLTDFMATAAHIVGETLPKDAGEDSYSFLPALLGEDLDQPIREATVHHSSMGWFAIRQGPWKMIDGKGGGGFPGADGDARQFEDDPPKQLYNLENDPTEQHNLYHEHPEIVERLTALLEGYKETGRSRPLTSTP